MQAVRVGIIGGGWPGLAHAQGYGSAGGFKLSAIADLIPERRKKFMADFSVPQEFASAEDLLAKAEVDAVSVCVPNHLHADVVVAALKAGKHVVCEPPPAASAADARKMQRAAEKAGKVLLYALQRRFGPHEQAARAALAKGFAGEVYHARAVWTRTRGIPVGTGWFTRREKSGGGALIDVGVHVLDIAWHLLGQPRPVTAYGVTQRRFGELVPTEIGSDVEDAAFAIIRFDGGKSLEVATSWAINQPAHQNGIACRIYGTEGTLEVYTPGGAVLYRNFGADGQYKENPLKPPKTVHHEALMRHFRDCIAGKSTPAPGGAEGVALMEMVEAIYKSSESGKSASV